MKQAQRTHGPGLAELGAAALRIGCLGVGGPAAQIALIHRVFTQERKWIREEDYLHALGYCMLLPGPEAQQLATYCGWRLKGIRGGLTTGLLFILPGALLLLALSWIYASFGTHPGFASLFTGIKAAIVGLVLQALFTIAGRSLKGTGERLLAGGAFLALFLFDAPFILILLLAAMIGSATRMGSPAQMADEHSPVAGPVRWRSLIVTALLWAAIWLSPVVASRLLLGPDHVLTQIGFLFSELSMIAFGGAYSLLAYLGQEAVIRHDWLSDHQMMDGLGLTGIIPGPLALINQFTGFMAGWQSDTGSPGLAIAGALLASWCTFAPGFVWIFAGAPFSEILRRSPVVSAAMAGVMAAVCGIIAIVALDFGEAILFSSPVGEPVAGTRFNPVAAMITLAATFALVRLRMGIVPVLLAGAIGGAALDLLVRAVQESGAAWP